MNSLNSHKVCGVVVLYEPDELLNERINSYLGWIEKLYIVDNSAHPNLLVKERFPGNTKIHYIFNNQNLGMAAALNLAAIYAINEGFSWLLTMDQDSEFVEEYVIKYKLFFTKISALNGIGVIGINYENDHTGSQNEEEIESVNAVITSGSLINLRIWENLGGFNEKLFIDEVDHEYCYRIISSGFQVVKLNGVRLNHNMGSLVQKGYAGSFNVKKRMVHSPLRIYYIVRNYLYVRNLFKKFLPGEFKNRDKDILNILKNNLFFSGQFLKTFRMAVKGYLHYRKGIFGKYP